MIIPELSREQIEEINQRYPIPCPVECGLEEPCIEHRKCGKWLGRDFCRWRDRRYLKMELRKRAQEEIEEIARLERAQPEEW